jgi:fatty acid CoA ligase FadD9
MNPQDDGLSLEVFVDWLVEACHNINRVADYDDRLGRRILRCRCRSGSR